MENSTQGLSMLEPEHKVVVTGEEHHQDALAPWAPRADGRPRRVAAELGFVTGPRGRRVIEVRVDGRRVGGLTVLMSERYAPHVHEVLRRGGRPGCVATVVHGRRGLVEVQLFLPEVERTGTAVLPPPAPRPAPAGAGSGGWPGGSGPGRGPRPGRRPVWVGVGVLAALVVVGSTIGNRSGDVPTVAAAAPSTTQPAAPTTIRPTPTPTPTPGPRTPAPTADPPVVAPAQVTRAPVTRAPATQVAPRTTTRAPAPAPDAAPVRQEAAPRNDCDPNYSGCVPVASDVDCAGGSGNGPAYVSGPVRVTGSDVYGLDSDDDGTGCE